MPWCLKRGGALGEGVKSEVMPQLGYFLLCDLEQID